MHVAAVWVDAKRRFVLIFFLLLAGCVPVNPPASTTVPELPATIPTQTNTAVDGTTPTPFDTPTTETCAPGNQDAYVYLAARLQVITACLRVTGIVHDVSMARDGDAHIRVEPDAGYTPLLDMANMKYQKGYLVVEAICVGKVREQVALKVCSADPDPLIELPKAGDHIWMEGRYVLDVGHAGWAEIHPLYRWGMLN
jgi:hypothetical protein